MYAPIKALDKQKSYVSESIKNIKDAREELREIGQELDAALSSPTADRAISAIVALGQANTSDVNEAARLLRVATERIDGLIGWLVSTESMLISAGVLTYRQKVWLNVMQAESRSISERLVALITDWYLPSPVGIVLKLARAHKLIREAVDYYEKAESIRKHLFT